MCANNLTPTNNNFTSTTNNTTAPPQAIPFDNCVPKNIRFYFNALKAISAYYPPANDTNSLPKQQHYELNNDAEVEEYNCLKDGITVGSKYVGNLINNNNNMCFNSWKRTGLINIKRTAGLVTPAKHSYSD